MRKKIIAAIMTAALTVSMAMSAFAAVTGSYVAGASGGYGNDDGSMLANVNLAWSNDHGVYPTTDGITFSEIYVGLKCDASAAGGTGDNDTSYLTANIAVETAGTYTIRLYLVASGSRYFRYAITNTSAVLTAWPGESVASNDSVEVTGGGWDAASNPLTYDITATLVAGNNTLYLSTVDAYEDGGYSSYKAPNVYGVSWTLVEAETTAASDETTTASAGSDSTATTAAASSTTTVAGGDESTTVAMVVIALVAVGAVVASKRKSVTE